MEDTCIGSSFLDCARQGQLPSRVETPLESQDSGTLLSELPALCVSIVILLCQEDDCPCSLMSTLSPLDEGHLIHHRLSSQKLSPLINPSIPSPSVTFLARSAPALQASIPSRPTISPTLSSSRLSTFPSSISLPEFAQSLSLFFSSPPLFPTRRLSFLPGLLQFPSNSSLSF